MPKERTSKKGPGTWLFKDIPRELMQRTKAGAAIQGKDSVKALILELVENHLKDLEKKGMLPKGKG